MTMTKRREEKMNLTLQVTRGFTADLDKEVAHVTPRASRSSVIQTAILEWMKRHKAERVES